MNTTQKVLITKSNKFERLKNKSFPIFLQMVSDTMSATLSFVIHYYLIFFSGLVVVNSVPSKLQFIMGLALVNFYIFVFFYFAGLYKNWYERSPFEEYFSIIKANFIGLLLFYLFVITDTTKPPRLTFLLYFVNLSLLTIIFRTIIRKIQKNLRIKGLIQLSTIVIGPIDKINLLKKDILKSPGWGLNFIGGVISDNSFNESNEVLGKIEDLDNILEAYHPESVILADADMSHKKMFEIVNKCSDLGIKIKIEPDLYSVFTGQTKTHNIYGIPFIEIDPQLMKSWEQTLKRIFDIIFSSLVLIIGLPFWLIIAAIVGLESKGGVFFHQIRSGKDNKEFKMIKFRSMVQNASQIGSAWTSVNDKRVTKFGKILRKSHLDEIPQFWNVIKGDMSIVGPRPEQPRLVEEFSKTYPHYKRRLKVRPGITGWWQVKYKSYEFDLAEIDGRLKDDFYYIENMSVKFDIEIVVRTVWCVIKGHGQA